MAQETTMEAKTKNSLMKFMTQTRIQKVNIMMNLKI